jgi:hypothetical protein
MLNGSREATTGEIEPRLLDQAIGNVQPHRRDALLLRDLKGFRNIRLGLDQPARLATQGSARQQPARQPVLTSRLSQAVDAAVERLGGIGQAVVWIDQSLEHHRSPDAQLM